MSRKVTSRNTEVRCGRVPPAVPYGRQGSSGVASTATTTRHRTPGPGRGCYSQRGHGASATISRSARSRHGRTCCPPEQQLDETVQRQFEGVKGGVAEDPAVQHEVTVYEVHACSALLAPSDPLARRARSAGRTRKAPGRRRPTPRGPPPAHGRMFLRLKRAPPVHSSNHPETVRPYAQQDPTRDGPGPPLSSCMAAPGNRNRPPSSPAPRLSRAAQAAAPPANARPASRHRVHGKVTRRTPSSSSQRTGNDTHPRPHPRAISRRHRRAAGLVESRKTSLPVGPDERRGGQRRVEPLRPGGQRPGRRRRFLRVASCTGTYTCTPWTRSS